MAGVITVGDAGRGNAHQPPDAPAPPPPAAPLATAPASVAVSMKDFEFAPKEIKIKIGTIVIWKNDGAKQHSATAADGSFDTALFGPGESKGVTVQQGRHLRLLLPAPRHARWQRHGRHRGGRGLI